MVGELLEPVSTFFSVAGAAGAGALAIWGFLRGLRAVHPDVHLRQIDRIERLLRGDEHDDAAPALPRDFVGLSRIATGHRQANGDRRLFAPSNHTRGGLVSILTMVADTRQLLVQRRRQLDREEECARRVRNRLADAA